MQKINVFDFYLKNLKSIELKNHLQKLSKGDFLQISPIASTLDTILFLYCLNNLPNQPIITLFIFDTFKNAEYAYSNLRSLNNIKQSVKFFPILEQANYENAKYLQSNLRRNAVLSSILEKKDTIIISHVEAITQNVKKIEKRDIFKISVGQNYNFTELTKKIYDNGFVKVDRVENPGHYAVRGGIVDVFSYSNCNPYRLDFYGDNIEEITLFDIETQCSVQNVNQANILGNKESHDSECTILEYLDPEIFVFYKNIDLERQELQSIDFKNKVRKFKNICFQDSLHQNLNQFELYNYSSSKQENINGNFNVFVQILEKNFNSGYENVISVSSETKAEKLASLLESHHIHSQIYSISNEQFSAGFVDHEFKVSLFTDHEIFGEVFESKLFKETAQHSGNFLKKLRTIEVGDYIVHKDFGIGKFAGLTKRNNQEVIRLIYKDNDIIHVSLQSLHKISKYKSKDESVPSMTKLGNANWSNKKAKIKNRLKEIAHELIQIYCKRRETKGFAFSPDNQLQIDMESSFTYTDTVDQASAMISIKKDMESDYPMDRLICGDVGFGKTELAIRAAFKATQDLKQVAVLVPTTILSYQHYESFCKRLIKFNTKIEFISRLKSAKETKDILEKLKNGDIDIIIGTHKLLSKDVQFADLGLLIVDEEQKFGVVAKEKIKELKLSVDILTLTATPIPRTLNFSLLGAKDFNLITTPPSNRQPIDTHLCEFKKEVISAAINNELSRDGQVLFVHNRVSDIESIGKKILEMAPKSAISIIHGQMPTVKLEKALFNFIQKKTNILLATSIIESGVDIPNANTLIVNDSHMFGLSDLHQMRGRVGRSNKKAFCYLIAPPISELSEESKQRLSTIVEFSNLGDGFKIAIRDLNIRGAGDLLGSEQSGFVSDVGFETFCQILDEAVSELKSGEFSEVFDKEKSEASNFLLKDCSIELDVPAYIPDSYIASSSERIQLYRRIDELRTHDDLKNILTEIRDRFGDPPQEVNEMMSLVNFRWEMMALGIDEVVLDKNFSKISLTKKALDHKISIDKIVSFVHKNSRYCSIQHLESRLIIINRNTQSLEDLKKNIDSFIN